MKIVYQNLKTKLRPILKIEDNKDLKKEIEALCWKGLGVGCLYETNEEEAKANRGAKYVYKSVLIFQKPVYIVVKEVL